jgi:hypothetical protein
MSVPALVIRLALEHRASVYVDCQNEAEELRLVDWLATRSEYAELVALALELSEQERAA